MPQRRSIRLPDYDYAANGAYFVTICTYDKEHLFGNIVDSQMSLNELGKVTEACWLGIPHHFSNVLIDAFVIMPNHVHGIIIIDKPSNNVDQKGLACQTPTNTPSTPIPRQFAKPIPQSLPTIVGAFKSAVTKRINLTREDRATIWQRNYHEHIIRDHARYELIAAYVETNPQRWAEDSLYSNK